MYSIIWMPDKFPSGPKIRILLSLLEYLKSGAFVDVK